MCMQRMEKMKGWNEDEEEEGPCCIYIKKKKRNRDWFIIKHVPRVALFLRTISVGAWVLPRSEDRGQPPFLDELDAGNLGASRRLREGATPPPEPHAPERRTPTTPCNWLAAPAAAAARSHQNGCWYQVYNGKSPRF